ncbi:universal stress protein [Sphingomonas sp. 1P08PE]|jgi:nucleotide-binding universal stress UspA family protein|uniref:universal stress protein n=1 Tax=Sphingomonas sp. 1P08PE TaxID=554122 RepID=UPI0039A2BB9E
MPYKSILVHVGPQPTSGDALAVAKQIAHRFDAALIGVAAESFDVPMSGVEDSLALATLREQVEADLDTASARFREATEDSGLTTGWIAIPGDPDRVLAVRARGADLIVANRPAKGIGSSMAPSLASLVLDSGTPVLVTPSHLHRDLRAERIVIGWKDTRESRRAVSDALPFLLEAEHVLVAAICKEARSDEATGLDEIVSRLERHGIKAEGRLVPRSAKCVGHDLENVAREAHADLLVLGAYGHSRFREWALGGVTEDLIERSSHHILFSH